MHFLGILGILFYTVGDVSCSPPGVPSEDKVLTSTPRSHPPALCGQQYENRSLKTQRHDAFHYCSCVQCGGRDSCALGSFLPYFYPSPMEQLACHTRQYWLQTTTSTGAPTRLRTSAPPRAQPQHAGSSRHGRSRILGSTTHARSSQRVLSSERLLYSRPGIRYSRLNKLSKSKGILHFICISTHTSHSIIHQFIDS